MNSNLNPQLFDPGDPALGPRASELGKFEAPMPRYMHTIGMSPNPLHRAESEDAPWRHLTGGGSEEFLPTYDLDSPQTIVNDYAVNHLVKHSTGLDTPDIVATREKSGRTSVYDGNHRTNAALRRGQMLIPARVYDV